MIKIGLIGASGKIGKTILALKDPSFEITALFTRENPAYSKAPIDLFLDFSTASALDHNLHVAAAAKKPIVIGTTGLSSFEPLKKAALSIPVFYSSNFSLGMALMRKVAIELAKRFHRTAKIHLIETHRLHKKDKPSGSALLLKKEIEKFHPAEIEIESIRIGDCPGEHVLHFQTEEEILSLSHQIQNRIAFAKGAIQAAHFLMHQKKGFFGMDDLLSMTHNSTP